MSIQRVLTSSWVLIMLLVGLTACSNQPPDPVEFQPTTIPTLEVRLSTPAPASTLTVDPTLTPSPSLEPTLSQTSVCSPLHGFQLAQLAEIVSNPFEMPSPGSDGGHHGVDFSFYSYGALTQMLGLPVRSMTGGVVAAVIDDRPPYGYAILVETPLESLPPGWQSVLNQLPTPAYNPANDRLNCPVPLPPLPIIETESRSLYLLYAHLEKFPSFETGMKVACGDQVGFVGTSGASVNPHLHLEARLGPSAVQFTSMAHYINNATQQEMANYCAWRIGPHFQLIDPMRLIQEIP